ncbi:MAG: 16S rRNA (adenine(1518)-N(6)/adenine(1519)-N(6))-dimethyltransferase RsmA [Bacteroidetes bacterium]|nr:16S rRNA (adenine(1518)-N(6)/adenine(1519)-N(6))-dimethyltransferase RsmA [Bacteroidota bacterium]MCY4223844.1 16S rRNA (adenine(1518)-N(6)/adenine(1519)-N(6))-dimethyltransferase RsmA [Bacteroidota bacterium]
MKSPIQPKKNLGQHFLIDPNTARRIVAGLRAPDEAYVVEIGPGLGALTGLLYDRFSNFEAIEIDSRAVNFLTNSYPKLNVRHMNILEVDWNAIGNSPLHVIGNLPYNITSPILFGCLDAHDVIAEAVFMVQSDVADRIVAKPRTKAYGIPSVFAQLYSRPSILFKVSRNVFNPKPAVQSSVIRLDFNGLAIPNVDSGLLHAVVRAAFSMRRKVLRNSLRQWADDLPDRWKRCRAEELSPEDYVMLAQYLRDQHHQCLIT